MKADDLEAIIISLILLNKDLPITEWTDLEPSVFRKYRAIYEKMYEQAIEKHKVPCYVHIASIINPHELDKIIDHARNVLPIMPSIDDINELKNELLKQVEYENIINVCSSMIEDAKKQTKLPSEIISLGNEKLTTLAKSTNVLSLGAAYELLKESSGKLYKLPWQNMPAYFSSGSVITISGMTSIGKSSFWINWIFREAMNNRKALIFDYEMGYAHLLRKFLTVKTGANGTDIKLLYYKDKDALYRRYGRDIDELSALPIYIMKSGSPNRLDLVREVTKFHMNINLDYVIVDYLQLVPPATIDINMSSAHRVNEICRSLKNMARELNIIVLLVSQLSRESSKLAVPTMFDLKESSSIEQQSDAVIMLYTSNKEYITSNEYEIIVEIQKNRDGPRQKFKTKFESHSQRFIGIL